MALEVATNAPLVDPWTGEDLGIPLVGVIDLIVGSPDGDVIADFKTSARSRDRRCPTDFRRWPAQWASGTVRNELACRTSC